jgi:bifunctional enzyme CysN/CysC
MTSVSEQDLIQRDIERYLELHEHKQLCRFVAVGSVDDGKSTLIGRLLHDTHGLYEDQLSAVRRASRLKSGQEIDFSLFTDGLKAEREQGITIDVAYRYFSTEKRKFIIADTPGHVQYTRNMATGASTADVAVILIDARLGVLQQSRRHAYIASLLGIPELAVCVNKMDLEGYRRERFEQIRGEFSRFAFKLGFSGVDFFPISAKGGDNVVHRSRNMTWYEGRTLLEHLEAVPIGGQRQQLPFRYPVQYVIRPNLDYRGFAGQIAAGGVQVGDPVMILPSRRRSRIAAIDSSDGPRGEAFAPMSVTLRLSDEVDVSRGDMIVHPDAAPRTDRRFDAILVWMSERPLDRQKSYLLKHTTQIVRAQVDHVAYVTDLETLDPLPAAHLELNEIGRVTLCCHRPIHYDAYTQSRSTGSFVLIDSLTNDTVAAGMILEGEPGPSDWVGGQRPDHPHTQVSPVERRERLGQTGLCVFLTGLPAAGKSALAFALERRLFDCGRLAVVIDPDDGATRHHLRADGSSPAHAPELARRLADAGVVTIFSFAAPLRADREAVRADVGAGRFFEVHVATSPEQCRARDLRGRWDWAHSAPSYEPPDSPDAVISLDSVDPEEAARRLADAIDARCRS